jgi:AcrR family transcriptional regulator
VRSVRDRANPSRERLSRDVIVSGAIALADAEGLEAVTIRRLAEDNAVTPMALYWHFRDKAALLDAIAERTFADIRLPETDGAEWTEALAAVLSAFLAAMHPHPSTANLVLTRVFSSEPGLALAERVLGLLVTAGFSDAHASQIGGYVLHALVSLVTMEPGAEPGLRPDLREETLRAKRAALLGLSRERYPTLVTCADALTACTDERAYHDMGIDLLIAGIQGVHPERAAAAASSTS